jgi:Protein of unknown function (DUF2490)
MSIKQDSHQHALQLSQAAGRVGRRLMFSLLCLALACMGQVARGQRAPQSETDTQQWNDVQIAVALNKQVDFNVFSAFRFGRNIKHLVDRRMGVGFTFKVGKYLTFAPSYLNIVTRPFEGRRGNENRLTFAATVRLPLGKKYALSDRNQFERRLRSTGDSTRYRNRIQLDHPVKFGKTLVTLFASEEVFYDWSVNDWVRNRFAVGVSRRFNDHFTGDLYYMRQNDGRSRPGDLHIIGATYRIRL